MIQLYHGDCLEIMKQIPDKLIDMILCDLPYGTTACKWDSVIPYEPLWEQYERIITDKGAIVLFGSQPFTTALFSSNLKLYKYNWVWTKSRAFDFLNSKNKPLKKHEDICVFSKGTVANKSKRLMTYNPQGLVPCEIKHSGMKNTERNKTGHRTWRPCLAGEYIQKYTNYPTSILYFDSESKPIHPTQKPVPLLEYLILTYTNPGDTVLDNCLGSGSTGVAAVNTGRNFIGIELDEHYFNISKQRIEETQHEKAS